MPVIGIYSFPKSGNTWVRHIISSMFDAEVTSIPDLHHQRFAHATDFDGVKFYKHHGPKLQRQIRGETFTTTHVIHIRRHPLDVFLSYMNLTSDNVWGTAEISFPSVDAIAGSELFEMYFHTFIVTGHLQKVGAGGGYFSSNLHWLAEQKKNKNVVSIRYEDMLEDPVRTLSFLADWIGVSEGRIAEAIERAEVRTKQDGRFFWRRRAGYHSEYISRDMLDRFLRFRGSDAEAIGYGPETFVRSGDNRDERSGQGEFSGE